MNLTKTPALVSLLFLALSSAAHAQSGLPFSPLPQQDPQIVSLPGVPALPPIGGVDLQSPDDTTSIVKAVVHQAADVAKFMSQNTKAEIGQASISRQSDGGYQVVVLTRTCETFQPDAQALGPFNLPSRSCKTYAKLIIDASPDADAQDGYRYQTFVSVEGK